MLRISGLSTVAAVLALVCGEWFLFGGNSQSALAQVAEALQRVRFARYTFVEVVEDETHGELVTERTVSVDLSKLRWRTETETSYNHVPYTLVEIQDDKAGKRLMINPQKRQATLIIVPRDNSGKSMLDHLREICRNENAEVSRDRVDGRKTDMYRVVDDSSDAVKGKTTRSVVTLWVDPDTSLPVQFRQELPEYKLRHIGTEFIWDPKIKDPDAFFGLAAPEGYTFNVIDKRHITNRASEHRENAGDRP